MIVVYQIKDLFSFIMASTRYMFAFLMRW